MTYLQFKTKPFQHQIDALEDSKDKEFYGIFWEMGLGKTKYALDLAAYLYNCGKILNVLFITKNGVDQQTVQEEIPTHLPLLEHQFLADFWRDSQRKWPLYKKYKDTLGTRLMIVAINCEALATKGGKEACEQFCLSRRTLLVVDESQEFKSISAQRTKNLLAFSDKCKFRRLMSGTPSGGNPVDYYSQAQILSPAIFPMSKWGFEYQYCIKQKGPVWYKDKVTGQPKQRIVENIVGFKNLDKLEAKIATVGSRKTKAECLDLPEKIYRKMPFELSDEERALYNRIKNQTLAEIAPGKYVDTTMAVQKLLRLQQVACGFVAFEDLVTGQRDVRVTPNPSRIKEVLKWTDTVRNKGLIWATYTLSIDQIIEELKKNYGEGSVVRYDGTVSDSQKQLNKIAFRNEKQVRWLVGHPKSGGAGLNLQEAEDCLYYSNHPSLITRLQSEDRIHRIGASTTRTYTDLFAVNTVESKLIDSLKAKFDVAAQLTGDELRQWIQ